MLETTAALSVLIIFTILLTLAIIFGKTMVQTVFGSFESENVSKCFGWIAISFGLLMFALIVANAFVVLVK